ncbi:MAG TPA: MFS transporter [Acidimicrobiales bacterium]|nr:MFS transporter [Acidimicrobiales bacterium]|tara:strand:- start:4056 stop:5306 length:1251 start_codon:yes stop_codon:yes gene_type:complete
MVKETGEKIPLKIYAILLVTFLSVLSLVGQITILGKQVYDITGRELDLGLLGLAEFAPTFLLAPFTGSLADRMDRRILFLWALLGEGAVSVILFWYATTNPTSILPIFWLVIFLGVCRAFAAPSGRALAVDMSPVSTVPRVVAFGSIAMQSGLIIGPVLFGFLFVAYEPLPYLVSAICLGGGALILGFVPSSKIQLLKTTGTKNALSDALEGFKFIRHTPMLFGAISLDLAAVLFGGAVALLPAIAEDRLGVGAVGLGWLRAAVGIGAGVVAVAMAIRPLNRHIGKTLLSVVAVFGLGTIVLGLSRNYVLAFVAVLILSAADAVSMFIRATLVPLATPGHMRGRVLALENVFIGASNELGAFESGVTAALMGLTGAIIFGGVGTLAVVVIWWFCFPVLRKVNQFDEVQTFNEESSS